MKQGRLRLLTCGLFVWIWVGAQEEESTQQPTFSQAEIEAAFDTCRALAEAEAETRRRFPMRFFGDDTPYSERLKRCVLTVLQGNIVKPMPLG